MLILQTKKGYCVVRKVNDSKQLRRCSAYLSTKDEAKVALLQIKGTELKKKLADLEKRWNKLTCNGDEVGFTWEEVLSMKKGVI